jgi:hypothetical protein
LQDRYAQRRYQYEVQGLSVQTSNIHL